MNTRRVTIEDVARAAGVSRQTVSRAINDMGEINAETRARILRIAEEMGYRPSSIARGLATRRTHTIGLIVPDNANPFFSDVARGVEDTAHQHEYNVFLCNTDEDVGRELAVLASLEEKCVDGLVWCSSRLDDDALRAAIPRYPAVVLVNRRMEGVGAVIVDDVAGARQAAEHLLRSGHRAIGRLAGPPVSRSGRQREAGYRAAWAKAGLPYPADYSRPCAPTVAGGQAAACELLTTYPELTALLCYNDLTAVGALQACADLGRRTPEDVAVVGFDDIPLASLVTPPLTTCRVDRYALGAQAIDLLLAELGHRPPAQTKEIVIEPELVIRASAPAQ